MEKREDGGRPEESLLTVQEIAFCVGAHRRIIERLVRLEVIEPCRRDPEPCFEPLLMERVRKALRLREELGVAWTSMALVMDLLERIDRLSDALRIAAENRRGDP